MDAMTPPAMLNQMPMVQPVTHDVKILRTRKVARARVVSVPPEEFGIERNARSIEESNYCFHRIPTHTEGSLIAEGYDKEAVQRLPTYSFANNTEQLARDTVDEEFVTGDDTANRAARPVEVIEHYIWMDYEGKGKPCLYKVTTGSTGQVLTKDGELDVEEFDQMPFASATPVPVPHRFFGRSLADLVMPVQREKTALKRGGLDNLYLHNNPRIEVAEATSGPNTLDDLLVSRPGGVVRTKTPGGLNWQVVPDITGSIFPMLQYLDAELETKTGLSKQSQGIDANALQNQSATAVAQVFSASQLRVKLIARNMAEGVRAIFSLLHATIRKHGQEAQTVRLRGSWIQVDPRQWKTREDMTIAVGLGTGGKAQQFAQTMAIGNFQKELLLGGKMNLVDDKALYNTGAELIKIMGHKNPDKFLNDPAAKGPDGQLLHPPQPPPPDPKVQIEQMKAQTNAQANMQKAQLDQQQAQIEGQQAADKAKLDAFHQQVKLEGELQLAREKAQLEKELALIDAALKERADQREHELHQQKMAHAQQMHEHSLQQGAQAHQAGMEKTVLEHHAKAHEAKAKEETKTGVHQTAKAVADLAESLNAPVEIIRDPKTNKAIGVKRGNKTMTVKRGKDGRAEKLQ
jgi:hypothetical protein